MFENTGLKDPKFKKSELGQFIASNHAKYVSLLKNAGPGLFTADEREKYLSVLKNTEFEHLTLETFVLNMLLAHEMRRKSHDPKTQTGAILSDIDGNVIYGGYNGLPFEKKLNNKMKNLFCTNRQDNFNNEFRYDARPMGRGMWHAEPNTIYGAIYRGYKVERNILSMPWYPCLPCANVIVSAGVKVFVCSTRKEDLDFNDPNWGKGWKDVCDLFDSKGVIVVFIPNEMVGRLLSPEEKPCLDVYAKQSMHYLNYYKKHNIQHIKL